VAQLGHPSPFAAVDGIELFGSRTRSPGPVISPSLPPSGATPTPATGKSPIVVGPGPLCSMTTASAVAHSSRGATPTLTGGSTNSTDDNSAPGSDNAPPADVVTEAQAEIRAVPGSSHHPPSPQGPGGSLGASGPAVVWADAVLSSALGDSSNSVRLSSSLRWVIASMHRSSPARLFHMAESPKVVRLRAAFPHMRTYLTLSCISASPLSWSHYLGG
jgi:hypothetical protein